MQIHELNNFTGDLGSGTYLAVDNGTDTGRISIKNFKDYVTPEMFGAVGDGATDDSAAIAEASQHGTVVGTKDAQYYIGETITVENDVIDLNLLISNTSAIIFSKDDLTVSNCEFQNDTYASSSSRGEWMAVVRNSANVTVKNCYFHKGVAALYIDRCTEINVHDNVFDDLRQYNSNGYGVLFIESQNAKVSNNIFKNVARHSIYISQDASSTYNENILINGNMFMWDSSVVGNTSGFELSINIRPSKYVSILDNVFLNVYGICSIVTQDIQIEGVTTEASSEHIYIKNNVGYFVKSSRSITTGIVFATAEDVSGSTGVSDLVFENNKVVIEQGALLNLNIFEDATIKNNDIRFEDTVNARIFNAPSAFANNPKATLIIDGNYIRNAFVFFQIESNAISFNTYRITNNDIEVTANMGNVVSGTTFDEIVIANNIINSSANRTYMSSATVGKLILKNNITNQIIALWLSASSVLSTDPCFSEYGYNSSNPSGCIAGSIHTWSNGNVYIMNASGTWVQV